MREEYISWLQSIMIHAQKMRSIGLDDSLICFYLLGELVKRYGMEAVSANTA